MFKRPIIRIDESKCDGCGLCVTGCAEGALAIIDGKARLVRESFCDGLGACLGECPRGALTLEEREAVPFDAEAATKHQEAPTNVHSSHPDNPPPPHIPCACPGTASRVLSSCMDDRGSEASGLSNWPVQLALASERAPYFEGADLLVAADCTLAATGDFHRRFLKGHTLLMACPKLDNALAHQNRLAAILKANDLRSIRVLHMEVPCCFGLVALVRNALSDAGKAIPLTLTRLSLRGELLSETKE